MQSLNVTDTFCVSQVMKCKLLPPTRTDLAGFNPLVPMGNISQVLLLANPTKVIIIDVVYYCDDLLI